MRSDGWTDQLRALDYLSLKSPNLQRCEKSRGEVKTAKVIITKVEFLPGLREVFKRWGPPTEIKTSR